MSQVKSNQKRYSFLVESVKSYLSYSLVFLLFLLLTSTLELILNSFNHTFETSFSKLLIWSFWNDLSFYFVILLPACLIFLIFYFISKKLAHFVTVFLMVTFFTIQLMLIYYFNTTLVLLGSDLFGYSLEEITQTVGASNSISLTPVLIFVLFVIVIFIALKFLRKILRPSLPVASLLLLFSIIFLFFGTSSLFGNPEFKDDFENKLVENKSEHFYSEAYSHFNPEVYETDIYADAYVQDYLSNYSTEEPLVYLDEANYPFYHNGSDRDVLSPFFKEGEKKPNIVFIFVEGLGRAFTNKGAYLGNFTPFIDSLSQKSLYWPNFLSSAGRTFGALPSIMGSLPFASTGFMEMKSMPKEVSLLNLLRSNGYQTNFYYGGNAEFDGMANFLRKNEVSSIHDEGTFAGGYKKIPASASGFTWGYGDKELFRYYLNSMPDDTTAAPKFNVLLTISTHSPFLTDEPEKYNEKYQQRIAGFGLNQTELKDYQNYKAQYESILYMDDALKSFFDGYKKRADYENTIFLITGDHRIPEIPMATKIDRYHVPLIIFSPMLKRSAEIRSISSHFDIAPSILSYLKNNYDVKVPETNSFIGQGLDTVRSFRNIHAIPLKQTKTNLVDFVMGEYHLNGEDLYKLDSQLGERRFNDPEKKTELLNAFNQFKIKNAQIIDGKKIIPDSIAQDYLD